VTQRTTGNGLFFICKQRQLFAACMGKELR